MESMKAALMQFHQNKMHRSLLGAHKTGWYHAGEPKSNTLRGMSNQKPATHLHTISLLCLMELKLC